ncbi:glucose dehydrogenase [Sphingobium fontiphilum]|uniref:Glucose dehydrogenase n=1 Tax=Sphingobium fontiphilum TaxID=944425 RepID=A0A7W6GPN3_9SPHN|nr:hypothetical protein [Sphingobium fontiphilum]MBB3982578.1 glucose dehydrogenase [Sphingobium fontiphilum]
MIHLTRIIVDLLTGLLAAGGWALLMVGGALTAIVGGGAGALMLIRVWKRR